MISPYGNDGEGSYLNENITIVYRAFHTTKEPRREMQPYTTASGAVITWDGRLDNRAELIGALGEFLTAESTDLSIVAAAYDTWGTDCFSRLMGDWALSIWNPGQRPLVLAKDPIGTRHLYYFFERDQVTWSTILDPLVLFSGKSLRLDEEYIAGWLSFSPAAHLTPYAEVHSVPPSCFVLLRPGSCSIKKYWDFDPRKTIVYATDGEYEEHLRAVFGHAVKRRLRSDSPILAELSGGMDSSSIVCMADTILAGGAAETPRLDTVSYYDDFEPNWNERPFFAKVEEKRGRSGCHIDVSKREPFNFELDGQHFAATPGSGASPTAISKKYSGCLSSNGNRVVLSGIGGDEVMGGVPTPTPEFENLLARFRFKTLAHQLKVWALEKRKPWLHLFFEAARAFFPATFVGVPKYKHPAPWLNLDFVKRNRAALRGYEQRLKLFGPLPSFQENLGTLEVLRRQLACGSLSLDPPFEKRYPYLDRELLEFIYGIPREQLVRPGQRRSLMRRALAGIVPDELLRRKRKAFVARGPLARISEEWPSPIQFSRQMQSAALGIVDSQRFADSRRRTQQARELSLVFLMRTFVIESWMRKLAGSGVIPPFGTETHMQAQMFIRRQIKSISA